MMKRALAYVAAFFAAVLFYGGWWQSSLLDDLDTKIYDAFVAYAPPPPFASTVIVEIDEKSLAALGQWPWPRVVMAQLLNNIALMEPSATAIDILFPEPDRTSPAVIAAFYRNFFGLDASVAGLPERLADNDRVMAEAIGRMNLTLPVYLDTAASGSGECTLPPASAVRPARQIEGLYSSPYLLCSLGVLQQAARGAGHIQASADHDGILRRLPLFIRYGEVLVPTLGAAAVLTLDSQINLSQEKKGGSVTAEILGHTVRGDEKSQVLLRFYPREWYRKVSALEVLEGKADPSLFRGKFVLIGATGMGLHDYYTLSDGTIRPGVYAHASLIENLFDDTLVSQPNEYRTAAFALSFLVAVVLMALMAAKRYLHVIALFFVALAGGGALGYRMMQRNEYISLGYFVVPLATFLFALALVLFLRYYRDQKRFYEKMSRANEAMIDSMALVAETRDTETGGHIVRTKEYVRLLAEYLAANGHYADLLTPEYISNLYHAAPLHDVGKVGIPDDILKKNAKLTVDEFEVMKTHTTMGEEIIDNAMRTYTNTGMLEIAYNIARYHHEKWDGSGYPAGLMGEEIPLEARMMALADVYDALISRRRYKEAFSFEESEEIIIAGKGSHFDPLLIDVFVELKREFRTIALHNAS